MQVFDLMSCILRGMFRRKCLAGQRLKLPLLVNRLLRGQDRSWSKSRSALRLYLLVVCNNVGSGNPGAPTKQAASSFGFFLENHHLLFSFISLIILLHLHVSWLKELEKSSWS